MRVKGLLDTGAIIALLGLAGENISVFSPLVNVVFGSVAGRPQDLQE
jgi:hypothetical protein